MGSNDIFDPNDDGYFDFVVNDNASLLTWNGIQTNISNKSQLLVKSNAQFMSMGGSIINSGRVLYADNSFIRCCGTSIQQGFGSQHYIHSGANISSNTFHPYWVPSGPAGQYDLPTTNINLVNMKNNNQVYDGYNAFSTTNNGYEFEALKFSNSEVILSSSSYNPNTKFDQLENSDFSIEIYFKSPTSHTGQSTFFMKGKYIHCGIKGNGYPYITVWTNSGISTKKVFPIDLKDDKCHNIVFTFNKVSGGDVSLYVDGKFVSSYPATNDFSTNSTALGVLIGRGRYDFNGNIGTPYTMPFFGWIGSMKLWNKVLTEEEICHNYLFKESLNTNGLLAYYDFGESNSSSTILTDKYTVNGSADGIFNTSYPPTWLSQLDINSCYNEGTNGNIIGYFRPSDNNEQENVEYENFDNLIVTPNPSHGNFSVKYVPQSESQQILLFNALGQLIYKDLYIIKHNENIVNLNVHINQYQSGFYFIKVIDGDKVWVKHVILR